MTTLSGFYAVSKIVPNTITFFSQTIIPTNIEPGWIITGLPGIQGQTSITSIGLYQGTYPGYGAFNGTIDFNVSVPQTIQGTQQASAVTVSPAPVIAPPIPPTLSGYYFTQKDVFVFYSNTPLPNNIRQGWIISGIPGIPGKLKVTSASFQAGNLGKIVYSGILTAVPVPPPPSSIPPNNKTIQKLFSVLTKSGNLADVLRGKIIGLSSDIAKSPSEFSTILYNSPNLLDFFSKKTNLQTESILADPSQLNDALEGLPELMNAIGYRIRSGPNKILDGFLDDENMITALGQGAVLVPSLPLTDGYPMGILINKQGAIFNPNTNDAFVPAQVSTIQPIVRKPIEDGNFKRFPADIRELDKDVPFPPQIEETLVEKRNLGFNAGGVLALDAIGSQHAYISDVKGDFKSSQWSPDYEQSTNSVLYQDYIQMNPVSPPTFIKQDESGTCVVEIQPKNRGDLLANMFLQCSLPALPPGFSYTNQIGRAIIQQVDFMIDDVIIETIHDDWLFIKDQIFLDYDEQIGMFNQINGGQGNTNLSPTTSVPLVIPLEFFFCRRHSYANKGRERLQRPFFPLCSLWGGQKIYIKFTFRPQYWFTNYAGPIDIQNPILLMEFIKLTRRESIYYRNTNFRHIVPIVKKDSTAPYSAGSVTTNLGANFPVQFIAWFIRNQAYESADSNYFDSRYLYGYATNYIRATTPLTFPSGTSLYLDVIKTVKITLNNQDILDTFANGPYASFLQPMQHGLSVPQKNIYMYSFALNVTEYNSGGYLNFSKINSQTSNLTITFLPQYASALTGYNLYTFYYGFSILEFKDGFAGVSYL
jgi:hypothetical protein